MNMQPVATVGNADRLAIKPAVTIGNPILEAFPEEALQRRRFPNSMLRNISAYLIKITSKSKGSNSPWQYVEFGRSRNPDANCSNAEVYRSTVDRALSRSSDPSQIPRPRKLSDNLVRSLQMIQHNNISLKNLHSLYINDRDRIRKMLNGSNSDRLPKKSSVSDSNATIINLLPRSEKDATEENISNSKNSNIGKTVLKNKVDHQNGDEIKRIETKSGKNMFNANSINIDINAKAIRRSKNVTLNEGYENIYNNGKIRTKNNSLITQGRSIDAATPQTDTVICKFITAKHMVCRQNDSAAAKVSIKPIYMTTSEITTVANDVNINRNSGVEDVSGESKSLGKKQRRRHDLAYQKYRYKYPRELIISSTIKPSTESARTSTILESTSSKNINKYGVTETWKPEKGNLTEAVAGSINYNVLFNEIYGQRNSREYYIKTKNNNLDSKKDIFGHKVRKNGKVSNYYNEYPKRRVTQSKRTASVTVSTNKIEGYTATNMEYDRAQKAASSVSERMSATEKTSNNYFSMKTEKLLYELNAPEIEIRPYFPTINDVDVTSNLLTSNHNAIQQNRGDEKFNETHRQSNISSEKFYENDENSIRSDDRIDSGLVNSDETLESITTDDSTRTMSKESRETLEEESEVDFEVVILNLTTTRAPEIVTRDTNESRERASTERHGKRKHKSHHNGRKNNRPKKKRKKNRDAKRKRKPTSTVVAWRADELTSVDYGNAYSTEPARTFSHNDPSYDKADGNRNTSTSRDWYLTDEITMEPFKTESSTADESVSKHPTEDSIYDGLQSKGTTNVNLVTSSTISHSSTASNEKVFKKCKVLITTTTDKSIWSWWANDNKKTDEESTECEDEDVTSSPTTSDSAEEETSYSSTYDTISKSSGTIFSWEYSSTENKKISSEETSTIYSTIKDGENDDKKGTTGKSILNEESDENRNEETPSWDRESTTRSVIGGTTHGVNSDLDSEEEEDATEKSISGEDNEIDNGLVAITEDYEIDNCNKTQHACDKYTCIDEDQVCDGIVDCLNANDETDCDYIYFKRFEEHQKFEFKNWSVEDWNANRLETNKLTDLTSNVIEDTSPDGCSRYEHPCDGTCIDALNVCDGVTDCLDGTDEANCTEGIPHVRK
ncbi:PREDICTED: zinc-regulated protein 8-like [Wasmannia auropunctata]|uniref:zinc-regulated protein 8-like n=1 Tax=Wasmannia auropunctata TaxID=64793 RepID=UPI0005ED868E|nr:PREDICTED: zinc-regulated protein 8-like [Wasmannia auropunctata]